MGHGDSTKLAWLIRNKHVKFKLWSERVAVCPDNLSIKLKPVLTLSLALHTGDKVKFKSSQVDILRHIEQTIAQNMGQRCFYAAGGEADGLSTGGWFGCPWPWPTDGDRHQGQIHVEWALAYINLQIFTTSYNSTTFQTYSSHFLPPTPLLSTFQTSNKWIQMVLKIFGLISCAKLSFHEIQAVIRMDEMKHLLESETKLHFSDK